MRSANLCFKFKALLAMLFLVLSCSACAYEKDLAPEPPVSAAPATAPESSPPETLPAATETTRSEYDLPGYSAEDVVLYFSEVCLAAEFQNGGDPSLVQKWVSPIGYALHGDPTQEDLEVVRDFTELLNSIEGFPGICEAEDEADAAMHIYFCSYPDFLSKMGSATGYDALDGAVTFWYNADQQIYAADICIRTDLPQLVRNCVILEEMYNAMGPMQDTSLRPDSIIYQEYSETQNLSEMDKLILRLLYHPQIQCGMTGQQCALVIQGLYCGDIP